MRSSRVVFAGLACSGVVFLSGWFAHAGSDDAKRAPGGPAPVVTAGPVADKPNGPEYPPKVDPQPEETVEVWNVHYSSPDQVNYYHHDPKDLRELLGIPPDGPVFFTGNGQGLDFVYVHLDRCWLVCIEL